MLRQILKQAFWDFYDHLGRLLFLNFFLFLTLFPLAYFGMVFAGVTLTGVSPGIRFPVLCVALAVLFSLLGTPWLAGLFHFGELSSLEKDPSWKEFFAGIRLHGLRVLRFLLGWSVLAALLLVNVWFYFLSGLLPESFAIAGFVAGGLCFWLLLLLVVILGHAMPLVVRRGFGFRRGMKYGFLLTLKYPGATFGAALFGASLLVIGGFLKFAGLVIFGFTLPVLLANSLHDVIVEREEQASATPPEEAGEKRTSWREIREEEEQQEEARLRRARYDRTFRDVIRPWEM